LEETRALLIANMTADHQLNPANWGLYNSAVELGKKLFERVAQMAQQ
jgi:hypothetical protein